jgi:toxin CcdB
MTRQFDVVPNPDAEDAAHRPYLVVLQSDLVSGLHSTIVAPLIPRGTFSGASRLNPVLAVDGRDFWLATHELFAVDRRLLHQATASVSDHRDAIIAAIDFVFTGF